MILCYSKINEVNSERNSRELMSLRGWEEGKNKGENKKEMRQDCRKEIVTYLLAEQTATAWSIAAVMAEHVRQEMWLSSVNGKSSG